MFGQNKTAREQQWIVQQLQQKVNEKDRCEQDQQRAQQKIKQKASDTMAARDLQQATQSLERIENEIDRLKNQL
jgi:uncharacterized protein (UPF0335 family)